MFTYCYFGYENSNKLLIIAKFSLFSFLNVFEMLISSFALPKALQAFRKIFRTSDRASLSSWSSLSWSCLISLLFKSHFKLIFFQTKLFEVRTYSSLLFSYHNDLMCQYFKRPRRFKNHVFFCFCFYSNRKVLKAFCPNGQVHTAQNWGCRGGLSPEKQPLENIRKNGCADLFFAAGRLFLKFQNQELEFEKKNWKRFVSILR